VPISRSRYYLFCTHACHLAQFHRVLNRIPIISCDPTGPDICQILFPDFSLCHIFPVCNTRLFVHKQSLRCCVQQNGCLFIIYVHYRLPKQVSTTVWKLLSQKIEIGVEFILKWLPNDRNPYQGRTNHVIKKKVIVSRI
jgi:hypothetical protein